MPNVQPQPGDQVGATPLSWSSKDAVDAALKEAQRSAYSPFKAAGQAADDYTRQRMQQAQGMVNQPWHSQAGIGTAMPEAAALQQVGAGWTGPVGQQLERLLGPERMARLANAPGRVDFTPVYNHPALRQFADKTYGVTLPEEYLKTGNPRVLEQIKGPQNNLIAIGPLAPEYNVAQQTALHEAVDHAIPLAEGTGHMMVPGEANKVFVGEYRNPSIDLHSPEYLTRLQQWYRSQGRGGTPHAAGDVVANQLASQGGFQPLDRSMALPILNRSLHERILQEIQQTGSYR